MANAEAELAVARELHDNTKHHRAVYVHAGQAVEFALKGIFIRANGLSSWPEDCRGANWHSIAFLARRCCVETAITRLAERRPTLVAFWLTARDWDHRARYPSFHVSRETATTMLRAVNHHADGVMGWLRSHYRTL